MSRPGPPEPPGAAEAVRLRAAAAAQVLVDDPHDPRVSPGDAHHLGRVLRLRPGEPVVVTDGAGRWRTCTYVGGSAAAGPGPLEPEGPVRFEAAPAPALTVAFAPAKGDRAEWVVQKLTELGVDRIVPLATARSVVRWDGDRAGRAVARLRRVAAEAAAQCRRVWLPEVTEVASLATLCTAVEGDRPQEPEPPALAELGGPSPSPATTVIAVGPEGGWEPGELEMGWPTVGLGPTVLRAETAAVAAGVLMCALRAGTVVARRR